MATAKLKVTGMKCGGCEKTVQDAVNALTGVVSSKASFKESTLDVEYDAAKTTVAAIQQAVKAVGFPAS